MVAEPLCFADLSPKAAGGKMSRRASRGPA